jgi:hypothetical protein
MNINKFFIGLAIASSALASCKNEDMSYPDANGYTTVYFASQYPARTVELGDDVNVDNSLDNQHKVEIKATLGGTQNNVKNVVIGFNVDTTLCKGLYYASGGTSGSKVVPMPSGYFTLTPSNQITIPSGSILGAVEVQLTDAFFADPLSLTNTYVIPLVMTDVQGADSILRGSPTLTDPSRFIDANWSVKPKDYILYAVKYVNTWHGNYLRRGLDKITKTTVGTDSTSFRHKTYVEQNDVVKLTTTSMKTVTLPLSIKNSSGTNVPFTLILTFAEDGTCTVSGNDANLDISGTGKFISKGEKNSFGGKDRDGLYLDYSVNFKTLNLLYATKDTLVVRDRAVQAEYFTIVKK